MSIANQGKTSLNQAFRRVRCSLRITWNLFGFRRTCGHFRARTEGNRQTHAGIYDLSCPTKVPLCYRCVRGIRTSDNIDLLIRLAFSSLLIHSVSRRRRRTTVTPFRIHLTLTRTNRFVIEQNLKANKRVTRKMSSKSITRWKMLQLELSFIVSSVESKQQQESTIIMTIEQRRLSTYSWFDHPSFPFGNVTLQRLFPIVRGHVAQKNVEDYNQKKAMRNGATVDQVTLVDGKNLIECSTIHRVFHIGLNR